MALAIPETVIISTTSLITYGPNQHIRAQVRCTDGPPDTFHVLILADAAKQLVALLESGQNPTVVVAGHLHAWTDHQKEPQIELALTHLGISLLNEFT